MLPFYRDCNKWEDLSEICRKQFSSTIGIVQYHSSWRCIYLSSLNFKLALILRKIQRIVEDNHANGKEIACVILIKLSFEFPWVNNAQQNVLQSHHMEAKSWMVIISRTSAFC